MNENEQEIVKVETEQVSSVGKMDIAGAFGASSIKIEKVKGAENFGKTLVRLVKYMKPEMWAIICMIILAAVGAWFAVWVPDILKKVTNHLVESIQYFKDVDLNYVGQICLTAGGLYCLNAIFTFISGLIAASMAQHVVRRMRYDIKCKLDKVPLSYYDQTTTGEILSRLTNDVEMVAVTLQDTINQIINLVMTVGGVLFMMFRLDWLLSVVTICSVPILFTVSGLIIRKSQKEFANQQQLIGKLNGHIEEMYAGHRVVMLYNHQEDSIEVFEKTNKQLLKATRKAQFLAGIILPCIKLVNNLCYVAICIIGGYRAGVGIISIGDIQACIQYTRQFAQPIENVSSIANTIQSAIASAERVFKMLDLDEQSEEKPHRDVSCFRGEVDFENVAFSYCKDRCLITNMNLHVNAADSIAIVGPTGAGKTTLVNLLMRFYDVDKGRILVDGVDIREMHRDDLRSLYGMVLQDTWLFKGTVADNIAYGNADATREEIMEAAKKAHAHDFIMSMEKGYDTELNDDASNISQGQKQLLTIARAILKDPKIIILDEATSSVDTRTEQYIQSAMLAMMEGRTSFVIAHRLSTIKSAAVILVMNHGDVVEQGNHESLMAKGGFYSDLYKSQFQGKPVGDSGEPDEDDEISRCGCEFIQT
ncbi:MAG TPA: ABC transporter ATP-binding protein [Clostridia bacterium]|nr:ABC transporter ATP-binding protein [Clostridia bacterium]